MLRVNEIFHSIDGEGPTAGLPSVFVRLQGCDLNCPWCDTQYARVMFDPSENPEEMDVQLIAEVVRSFGCMRATITGGEPLLQRETPELVRVLLESGIKVSVETNGAHDIQPLLLDGVTIVMDWKMPSSGMDDRMMFKNLGALRDTDVVKCVIGDLADLDLIPWLLDKTDARIYLSPVFGKVAPRDIVEKVLDEGWDVRVQVQLHKIIWSPEARGV